MTKEDKDILIDYIFTVQTLVDKLNLLRTEIRDYERIEKRIKALEKLEDKLYKITR